MGRLKVRLQKRNMHGIDNGLLQQNGTRWIEHRPLALYSISALAILRIKAHLIYALTPHALPPKILGTRQRIAELNALSGQCANVGMLGE